MLGMKLFSVDEEDVVGPTPPNISGPIPEGPSRSGGREVGLSRKGSILDVADVILGEVEVRQGLEMRQADTGPLRAEA
ncbi:hypothetical protein EYF80_006478 [Liparis tanakae]|uniref:Uncharacterized protein n=1 Tax=Liparis tanakae TaxID=230148 RepID=A0A4Z2J0F1_9TELE|nr:hypothetical protein EYF80_006478 [Liparis tanakae]